MAKLGDYVSHIGIDVRPDFGHIQIFGRPDFGHLLATPILNFCDKQITLDNLHFDDPIRGHFQLTPSK